MADGSMKDKIVRAAEEIFWQRGFHGATMDDVISAAETTPRTLYRHFVSKQALAAATIVSRSDRFHDWYAQRISELLNGGESFPRSAVLAMGEWIKEQVSGGCYFLRGFSDYKYIDTNVARIALEEKSRIRVLLKQIAVQHEIAAEIALFDRLYLILEGLIAASQTMELDTALGAALFLTSADGEVGPKTLHHSSR